MDDVEFWVVFRGAGCGMDVVTAEERTKLKGGREGDVGEVLVTKSDNFALRDEQGKLGFSGFV